MRSYAVLSVALAFASSASSQLIQPNSVDLGTRQTWCLNQRTQCPLLCSQQTDDGSTTTRQNTCIPESLAWQCVCGDGQTINGTQYSQTIPFYECTERNNQCVANCGISNPQCAANCREQNPCGATDPERVNSSTIAPTATATGAETGSTNNPAETSANFDSFGDAQPSSSSNNNQGGGSGAAGLAVGQSFGLAVVVAGLFGGFALML